jgi:predicted permease
VGFPREGYESHEKTARAFDAIVENLRARPEVRAAALVSKLPLSWGGPTNGLIPEGRPLGAKSAINTDLQIVSSGYFETMGIPLRAGRFLEAGDRRGAPRVMVINEELARVAFPGVNPLGKRVACCEPGAEGPESPSWKEIVGVVANVSPASPGAPANPQFYLPLDQVPEVAWDWISRTLGLVVRTASTPRVVVPFVRAAVRAVDPNVPVFDVQTMAERRRATTAQERFGAILLSALGACGLVLAAVGIYGVIAFFVSQRTREIAVRQVMGAGPSDVMSLVLRQGLRPALLGVALGAVGAVLAGRALQAMLFGVSAADPVTLTLVAALLVLVATLASVVPARRACRVDPARALADG